MSKQQLGNALTRIVVEVELVGNTNVRQAPTRTSPIARVLRASDFVVMAGYTTAGENIQGNSSWYFTQDGKYIWAGATTRPNPSIAEAPVHASESIFVNAPAGPLMSGIERIDGLLSGAAQPLTSNDQDVQGIGAVQ